MLKIAFNQNYIYPLEENHRFPMIKYELIPEQLIRENTCVNDNFFNPGKIDKKLVLLTHQKEYFNRFKSLKLSKKEIREIGFPLSKELVEREMEIAQGTVMGVNYSLKNGISMNIAGGTHHAFFDRGEAFCMLNDQSIAANYLLKEKLVKKIMIIDLDVHQGNGTASIMKNENKVFTFSMHGKNNYPFKKEISNLDVELEDKIGDEEYLKILSESLNKIESSISPEFVFFISGVDILSTDKLGRLNVSREGCKKRDEIVYEYAYKNNLPIVTSMGGGYSEKIYDIVEAHCNTFKVMNNLI